MRSSLHASLYTAVALCTAAPLAGAQRAATLDHAPPVALIDGPSADVVRSIITYRFDGWHGADLPSEVSLADSAGTFVASYRTPRSRAARPMSVVVRGPDVILSGETAGGLLTLAFYERTDSAGGSPFVGRWTLGEQSGELRGRLVPRR